MKPSAMCCTTRTGAASAAGNALKIAASAGGPPVDAPMTTSGRPPPAILRAGTPFRAAVPTRGSCRRGRPGATPGTPETSRPRKWRITVALLATRT